MSKLYLLITLESGGASGRERTGERTEKQLDRIVPRGYNQRIAERFRKNAASRREHFQRRAHLCGSRPSVKMFQLVFNLSAHYAQFRQEGLFIRLVKIDSERVGKRLLPFLQCRPKCAQIFLPASRLKRRSGAEQLLLRPSKPFYSFRRCIFHNP